MSNLMVLLQNKYVQLALTLVIGITVGAVFYPTKTTEEKVRKEITEEYELKIEEKEKLHILETQQLMSSLESQENSNREYKEQTEHKLQKLVQENHSLKQSMKKKKLKIVKPDGTIVEEEIEEWNSEESNSIITEVREEFTRKVEEIESKWKKIHEMRVAQIKTEYEAELEKARKETKTVEVVVEKEKIVEVNKKKLRPEIGLTSDQSMYIHGTYTVWGPTFIGGGVSGSKNGFGDARIGVGLEF